MNPETMTNAGIAAHLQQMTRTGLFKQVPPAARGIVLEAIKRLQPDPKDWTVRAAEAAHGIILQHFDNDAWVVPAERGDGRSPSHLHWMALELVKAEMSPTKACRWLGYLQAGLIYNGVSTLKLEKLRNLETGA